MWPVSTYSDPISTNVLTLFASFCKYLSGLPEYHNIATRMFSRDVPPYGGKPGGKDSAAEAVSVGVTLGPHELRVALTRLEGFAWVGLMELMGTSLLLLAAKLGARLDRSDFARLRASHTPAYEAFARALRPSPRESDPHKTLPARIARVVAANAYDEALWHASRRRQCADLTALGLQTHPLVLRDLDGARSTPPCALLPSPLPSPQAS